MKNLINITLFTIMMGGTLSCRPSNQFTEAQDNYCSGPKECHVTITGCTDLTNDGIDACPKPGDIDGNGGSPIAVDVGGDYSPPTGAGSSDGGGESTENIPEISIVDVGGGAGNPGGRDGSVGEGGGEGLPGEDPGDFGGDRPNGGIDNPTRTGGGGNPDIFENPGKVLGDLWGGVVGFFNGDYYEKKRKAREGRKLQKEATNLLVELSELEKSAKASQEGINKGFDNLDRGATEWDNSKQNTNPEKFTRTYNEGVDRTVDRFPPVSPEDFRDDDKNTPDGYPKPRYDYPEKEKVERGRRYADYAKKQIDSNPNIYKNPEERKRVVDYGDGAFDNAEAAYRAGNPLEGELWNELGVTAVDVALSLTPGVSLGKDIAEAITGKNILTGETLSTFERSMAVAGALTFGVGSKLSLIGKGFKVAEGISKAATAGKSADEAADIAKAIERGTDVAVAASKAGVKDKRIIDDVVEWVRDGRPCVVSTKRMKIFQYLFSVVEDVAYASNCVPTEGAKKVEGIFDTAADLKKKFNNDVPWASTTKSPDSAVNAAKHWEKHGSEFPDLKSAEEYIKRAQDIVKSPPPNSLVKQTRNGTDTVIYHQDANTLVIKTQNDLPTTMYKPDPIKHGYPSNLDFFNLNLF